MTKIVDRNLKSFFVGFFWFLFFASALQGQESLDSSGVPSAPPSPAPVQSAAPDSESNRSTQNTQAQITGKSLHVVVIQKGTGLPIKRAEIKIGEEKFVTGIDGGADVPVPTEGSIIVSRFGYQELEVKAADVQGKTSYDVYLFPSVGDDDVIVITGKRRPAVSKKNVSIEEARQVAPRGDPGQVIKLLPGVQSASPFQSTVSIRGSRPEDSKYYIDDIEVPFAYHTIGQYTVVPAAMISDVEFSAGGFGTEYGNAMGGVVAIRTKSEIPERPLTKFTLNLPIYSGVYHERPLSEDSAISVSARRSYLEILLPLFLPKDAGLTVAPYFSDYRAVYIHKREDGHDKFTLMAADDGAKVVSATNGSEEDGRGQFDIYTYYGVVGLEHLQRINADWSYTTTPQLFFTRNRFTFVDNKFRLGVWQSRVPTEATMRLNKDEKLYLGFEPLYGRADVYFLVPRFNPDDPFFDFEEAPKEEGKEIVSYSQLSTWAAVDQKFGSFTITPGVRAFYDSNIKKADMDPRIIWRYELNSDHSLKGAVGQYSKSPENGQGSESYGNPKLTFARTNHYILGVESKWTDRWTTDFQMYYKRGYRMIRSAAVPEKFSNKGSQESRGFEAFVRRNLTARAFGWLSYTYSVTKERDSDDESWYASKNDQTHVLNLVGGYKLSPLWESGTRFNYHTGDTNTPRKNPVYNANLDKYQPRGEPGDLNSDRLPGYNELSCFLQRALLYDSWKAQMRFGVEYLWYERQVSGIQYNYDYSKKEYFRGVPPIPYFEIEGQF